MGIDCVSRTHVGLRRKLNEDAVLNCPERKIWAVADGMGGHEAGEVASGKIISALSTIATMGKLDNVLENAVAILESVNTELVRLGNAGNEQRTIGSTVVGLLLDDSHYACFWVGDSRAYLLRDGTILQISRDHSLVQELIDAGMLDSTDAENHPNANIVTRAVGATDALKVDAVSGELRRGDIFVLASDGLTRPVKDSELLAELSARTLDSAADHLIALTLERGAPDNVSFVVLKIA